ncbi:hypothetical protein [Photobacterium angustum]|nr:hypothetical protein [Photobacterium angustum]
MNKYLTQLTLCGKWPTTIDNKSSALHRINRPLDTLLNILIIK